MNSIVCLKGGVSLSVEGNYLDLCRAKLTF